MNIQVHLEKKNYKKVFNYFLSKYQGLTKEELKELKLLLLYSAVSYVLQNEKENIFNKDHNLLKKIKMLFDMDKEIFIYIYDNINNNNLIITELSKHKYYSKNLFFIKKNKMNTFSKKIKKNGLGIKTNYFKEKYINKLKKESLYYLENTKKTSFPVYTSYCEGKTRITFTNNKDSPKLFQKVMNNNKLKKIIKNIVGSNVICTSMQVELIEKADFFCEYTYWHIDKLTDQYKIMIPLENINEDCAPLAYIEKSHIIKNNPNFISNHYHMIYQVSSDYVLPSNLFSSESIRNSNLEIKKGNAKKGDLIVFDTSILHSAQQIENNNRRLNLVIIFHKLETNRNKIFTLLKSFYNF